MEDAADASDREFEGIPIGQRRVDVTEVWAIERFFKKIAFEEFGEDGQEVVAGARDVEADREAKPAAVLGTELAIPFVGVGIEDVVTHVVVDGDLPAELGEFLDFFAAELVPKRIDSDAAWVGKPAIDGWAVFGVAGFELEQKAPS